MEHRPILPSNREDIDSYKLKPGDIVFARTGATTGKSFLIQECSEDAIFASYLIRVRPKNTIDPRFLAHFFNTPDYWAQIRQQSVGSGQPGVNSSRLRSLSVPVPPFEEQQRIATILDQADAIRRKRRQAIGLSDHLIQSVFFELFGDTWTNARGWPTGNLEDLCGNIVDCPHSTPVYSDHQTNLYCVRSSDIQQGKIDFGSTLQVSAEVFEERIRRYRPQQGDVIYTREGGRLGNAAQVPPSKNLCLGQRMMLFSAKPLESTNEFIWALLNSPGVRKQVEYLTGGAAAPRINIADIRFFKVVKPPYNVQEKFSRIVAKIRETDVLCMNLNSRVEYMFTSIVGRAFRGEL